MALIDRTKLLEAGWPRDEELLETLLEAAAVQEGRGVTDEAYILKLLAKRFDKPNHALRMRDEPVPHSEAIRASTREDEKNLAAVRRFMRDLMRCPVVEAGAIMPDACPAGQAEATIPVGGAVAARGAILPAAHGHDICCSMHASVFESAKPVEELLDAIVGATRFGPGGREPGDRVAHPVLDEAVWTNPFLSGLQEYARMHLADQGDGNHFAFLGRLRWTQPLVEALDAAGQTELSEAGRRQLEAGRAESLVLVTHHGSRGLGARVFQRGMAAAVKQTATVAAGIPEAAAWLSVDTPEGSDYWESLQYVGRWTLANHQCIHQRFLTAIESPALAQFGNEHNFVWRRGEHFLHGKGATPAWSDAAGHPLLGLIPLNMASPILMVLGRGNEEHLSFAPHGAGRNVSRRGLLKRFRLKDGGLDLKTMDRTLAESTEGVDVRWYLGEADLTESPVAYKPAGQVRSQIAEFDLAQVIAEIEPLGSVMAGHAPRRGDEEKLTAKQIRQIAHRSERRKNRQRLREGEWGEEK